MRAYTPLDEAMEYFIRTHDKGFSLLLLALATWNSFGLKLKIQVDRQQVAPLVI